jgi:RNA polymerase sigma factor (TIGR02999 family)
MTSEAEGITQLLVAWNKGEDTAFAELIPLVYPELRKMARRYMVREREEHTLQTSALINEAYMRLADQKKVDWQDRAHFYAVAAQVMRHILVDHARKAKYDKRGAGAHHVALDDAISVGILERAGDLVALDEALTSLFDFDPRKSRVVELRFFGGLTVEEIARLLCLSPVTVMREWRAAKAWLHRELTQDATRKLCP